MKKILLTVTMFLLLVASIFVLTGCEGKKEETAKGVVGQWAYSSSYIYTFNSDKTGNYNVSGKEMKFTYEDDGEKLSISFEGTTEPTVSKYRIEGNKLIIKDSLGNDVEYVKK